MKRSPPRKKRQRRSNSDPLTRLRSPGSDAGAFLMTIFGERRSLTSADVNGPLPNFVDGKILSNPVAKLN